ncbi:hypothetical protein RB919 [Rhodopirellula baltica SH 1]|uniref:Uncharacterized protein n=1 Tax=Rhodopirellula baltica (strain DSM 10527 / NCIMB 13988 / SH1) TaxID=243090 RepID=Q7UY31_RHOBA|nr:hypothetical protein RB919 [Rhodopirellula baltica SH 1]
MANEVCGTNRIVGHNGKPAADNGVLDDRVSYMLGNGGERVLILAEGGSVCSTERPGECAGTRCCVRCYRSTSVKSVVFHTKIRWQSHLPRWQTRRTSCGAEFNSQLRMS